MEFSSDNYTDNLSEQETNNTSLKQENDNNSLKISYGMEFIKNLSDIEFEDLLNLQGKYQNIEYLVKVYCSGFTLNEIEEMHPRLNRIFELKLRKNNFIKTLKTNTVACIFDFDSTLVFLNNIGGMEHNKVESYRTLPQKTYTDRALYDLTCLIPAFNLLKRLGIKLGIVTNRTDNIHEFLEHSDTKKYFDQILHGTGYDDPKNVRLKNMCKSFGVDDLSRVNFYDDNKYHCHNATNIGINAINMVHNLSGSFGELDTYDMVMVSDDLLGK